MPFVTRLPDQEYTCLDDSTTTKEDKLAKYLCSKGLAISGECENACYDPSTSGDLGFSLIYPTYETQINGEWGIQRVYTVTENGVNITKRDYHTGVDFSIPKGSDVRAAASGVVIFSGWDTINTSGGYGNVIMIRHANGFVTLYAHNDLLLVPQGEVVNQGDVIAKSGSTGNSTGPHLHFELRRNETCGFDGNINDGGPGACTIDPRPYFNARVTDVPTPFTTNSADLTLFPISKTLQIPQCKEVTAQSVNLLGRPSINPVTLVPEAATALTSLLTDMQSENQDAFLSCGFNWGYRSSTVQASFGSCNPDPNIRSPVACACHSEHQLGTTVDFAAIRNGVPVDNSLGNFAGTQCFNWLNANAKDYGFVRSYDGSDPQYSSEAWHWRWIGVGNAQEFDRDRSSYGYLRKFLEEKTGLADVIAQANSQGSGSLQCLANPIPQSGGVNFGRGDVPDSTLYQIGVLSCDINLRNVGDVVDFEKLKLTQYLDVYVESYNLDDNLSYTWVANASYEERESTKAKIIQKLGQEGYVRDRNQRLEVTNFVIDKALDLGLNPRFILTLWLEESGGSALGTRALGCLGFRTSGAYANRSTYATGALPIPSTKDQMLQHMNEQIECVDSYIKEFGTFTRFMCTFSGEVGRPDCDTRNFQTNPNFPVSICKIYDVL